MIEFRTIASSSAGCCYLVSGGGSTAPLMIDCGITMAALRASLGFPVHQLAGCLVSHLHQDHCKAAKALTQAGVEVWASRPTLDAIATDRPYMTHELKWIGTETTYERVGPWSVLPFDVQHDCPGALGFVITSLEGDRLLYLTDSCYSKFRFVGLTHIVAECNHSEEIIRKHVDEGVISADRFARTLATHMSLERLLEFLKACDLSTVRQIWLTHLSDTNSDEAAFKAAVEAATGIPCTVAPKG